MQRILVVRPDRIGDVVLSTPVLEALRRQFPEAQIDFLVRPEVAPVVEGNPFYSKLLTLDLGAAGAGGDVARAWRLSRVLRREHYDAAVVLQSTFWVSLAVFLARVPVRVGPLSKLHTYFLFNRGVRQKRSRVEMHEAQYNLALLAPLVGGSGGTPADVEPTLTADLSALERVRLVLRRAQLTEGAFVVVHAGMGGSALNWPQQNYAQLVHRLATKGIGVVLTGGPHEKSLVATVLEKSEVGDDSTLRARVHSFVEESTGVRDLKAMMALSRVVVAPSTGPLHIASALGKRTVSFYPPIRVQSAKRWGPYSLMPGKHTTLVPQVSCGQPFACAGARCEHHLCMEKISVDVAFNAVLEQLEKNENGLQSKKS